MIMSRTLTCAAATLVCPLAFFHQALPARRIEWGFAIRSDLVR